MPSHSASTDSMTSADSPENAMLAKEFTSNMIFTMLVTLGYHRMCAGPVELAHPARVATSGGLFSPVHRDGLIHGRLAARSC